MLINFPFLPEAAGEVQWIFSIFAIVLFFLLSIKYFYKAGKVKDISDAYAGGFYAVLTVLSVISVYSVLALFAIGYVLAAIALVVFVVGIAYQDRATILKRLKNGWFMSSSNEIIHETKSGIGLLINHLKVKYSKKNASPERNLTE